jgi:hypothetical protein
MVFLRPSSTGTTHQQQEQPSVTEESLSGIADSNRNCLVVFKKKSPSGKWAQQLTTTQQYEQASPYQRPSDIAAAQAATPNALEAITIATESSQQPITTTSFTNAVATDPAWLLTPPTPQDRSSRLQYERRKRQSVYDGELEPEGKRGMEASVVSVATTSNVPVGSIAPISTTKTRITSVSPMVILQRLQQQQQQLSQISPTTTREQQIQVPAHGNTSASLVVLGPETAMPSPDRIKLRVTAVSETAPQPIAQQQQPQIQQIQQQLESPLSTASTQSDEELTRMLPDLMPSKKNDSDSCCSNDNDHNDDDPLDSLEAEVNGRNKLAMVRFVSLSLCL